MPTRAIHIREVATAPTPDRRIWNVYIGNEKVDWIALDLRNESIGLTIRNCLTAYQLQVKQAREDKMPQQAETMTPAEALLWLASLEKNCAGCVGCRRDHDEDPRGICACIICHGTGKVPVLDLREPCRHSTTQGYFEKICRATGCSGWLPKQGRDALHDAMEKDEWNYDVSQRYGERTVHFFQVIEGQWAAGLDSDDHLAAVKAIEAAGY